MSRTHLKRSLFTTTILGTLVLTACGGGGGSSSTSTPTSEAFSATVTGVGAKGFMKRAVVTAVELNDKGEEVGTVGSGETGDDGKYSLTIGAGYKGGPLKMKLSAKDSNGTTKMVCDVVTGCGAGIAFGQDYTLPADFALTAIKPAVSNGATVPAPITPFTHMAVARVQALAAAAPLTNDMVNSVVSEVSQIVGVDIGTVEPVNINDVAAVEGATPEAVQYAAFNAGIGNVAFADSDFANGLNKVAESFADDGAFDSNDPVSITTIVAAVEAEATNITTNIVTDPAITTVLTNTVATLQTETASGSYDPQPADASTQTAVAQAKALVSQTRAWGTELATLQTPADAFGVDIDTASAVLNSNSGVLGGVFGEVLGGALDVVRTETASPAGLLAQTYNYSITYWGDTSMVSGSASVTVSNNSGTVKLTISAPNIAGTATTATVITSIPSTVLGVSSPSFSLTNGLTMNVTGSATMNTTSGAASIAINNAALTATLKTGVTATTATALDSDFASLGFDGGLTMAANGVTFAGTGSLSFVANNVIGAKSPLSLEEIAVSGTFTGSKGSFNASASVKFNNAATFDTIGLLTHEPEVWVNEWAPGDTFGVVAAYSTLSGGDTLLNGYYDSWSNQTCFTGALLGYQCQAGDAGNVTATIQALYPTALSVQYVWVTYDQSWGTQYSAMVSYPDFETASNYANATITLSSSLALAGFPQASLTVTGNRTAYSDVSPIEGTLIATLAYNGQSLTFTGDTTTSPESGKLTVSNPDGVKLEVLATVNSTATGVTGSVTVDGTQVGTIDSSSGITLIRYNDGTFESLQ